MLGVKTLDEQTPRAARFLEGALLFTFFIHALGMLTMAGMLLPGMPGAGAVDVAHRAGYVANHPWIWRVGWLGWQITAASDLLLAIALLATRWIPKLPAALTLLITIAAIVPDQVGQWRWTWIGTALARDAVRSGSFAKYLDFESHTFALIAGWGTAGYVLGAIGWTWCFAAGGAWSRRLTYLSFITWTLFISVTFTTFLPGQALAKAVAGGNAIAFVLLMIWLALVTEAVLGKSRPKTFWRYPRKTIFGSICNLIANSLFVRAIAEYLPALSMASDITNVVYVNYLLPVDRLEKFVPPPLKIQRLGPKQNWAMFTFLTYQHGHFGPVIFGPLRRLWPSPVQSNWRVYVIDPATGRRGVHFLTTAISSTPHALAARLLSEGVPMHVPARAKVERASNGDIEILLDPGEGTSPDVVAAFTEKINHEMSSQWLEVFGTSMKMLEYCVPQDRAFAVQKWYGRIVRQEINLGIPLESCVPIQGSIASNSAAGIAGEAIPICFLVEKVRFRFFGETFEPINAWTTAAPASDSVPVMIQRSVETSD